MPKPDRLINKLAKPLGLALLLPLLLVLGLLGRDQSTGSSADFQKYHNKHFTVLRVVDGDTIKLDTPDRAEPATTVRLWGIDTPETKAPGKPIAYFGPEATQVTTRLVDRREVNIELDPQNTRGKFGRLLAFVYTDDGRMLNEELLRSGHAYADNRWRHRFYFRFLQIEAQARKNKIGLWQNVKPRDMPPHVQQRLNLAD